MSSSRDRRRVSFLDIIRRKNTCEILQITLSQQKFKVEQVPFALEHVFEDEYKPIKREIQQEKRSGESFGIDVFRCRNALYVASVVRGSPAYMAGLQFGDQLMSVADKEATSIDIDYIHAYLNMSHTVCMTVCDTPLFRSFVLHRQSRREPWGLTYKKHTITRIATKSPAHRAGVPAVGWAVVNVNGQNTLLMTDRDVAQLISKGHDTEGGEQLLELLMMPETYLEEFQAYLNSILSHRTHNNYANDLLDIDSLAVPGRPSSANTSLTSLVGL